MFTKDLYEIKFCPIMIRKRLANNIKNPVKDMADVLNTEIKGPIGYLSDRSQ